MRHNTNTTPSRQEQLRLARKRWTGRATIARPDDKSAPNNTSTKSTAYTQRSLRRRAFQNLKGTGHKLPFMPIAVVLIAVAVCTTAIFASTTVSANIHKASFFAEEVWESYTSYTNAVTENNFAAATKASEQMSQDANHLQQLTQDKLWSVAAYLPGIGSDVRAAKELAAASTLLTHDIVEPYVNVAAPTKQLSVYTQSKIEVEQLSQSLQSLSAAKEQIHSLKQQLSSLNLTDNSRFAASVTQASNTLAELERRSALAQLLSPHIKTVLGSAQTRNYLVVVLDNAQLRSLGGAPLCQAVLKVSDGAMILQSFSFVGDQNAYVSSEKLITASDEENALVGDALSSQVSLITSIPQSDRALELLAQAYNTQNGEHIDGVVMLDPYAVQSLLEVVGDVTVDQGSASSTGGYDYVYQDASTAQSTDQEAGLTLTHNNFAHAILRDLAENTDPGQQARLLEHAFNASIGSLFEKLDQIDHSKLAEVIKISADTHHLSLWFADDEEEKVAQQLGLGGIDPTSHADAGASKNEKSQAEKGTATDKQATSSDTLPELGVFLNEKTSGRISWYLEAKTRIADTPQVSKGMRSYQLSTTLTNTLQLSDLSRLWSSPGGFVVLGSSEGGRRSDADMMLDLYLLAPKGAEITDINASNELRDRMGYGLVFTHETLEWQGRQLIRCAVQVDYDETVKLSYTVTCPAKSEDLVLIQTPSAKDVTTQTE